MIRKIVVFIFLFIFSGSVSAFSQSYVRNFFEKGFPRLSDYSRSEYDILVKGETVSLNFSDSINQKIIPKRFQRRMKMMRTAAFLVIKDNEVVYENYWMKYNKDSLLNSFSVSKGIVSLLVGIAIEEGKIEGLSQKVSDFLPQFNEKRGANLRIIDLLSMSSGLNWNQQFANLFSDIVKAYYTSSLLDMVDKMYVKTIPGQKWKYQCGNTILLTLILEKATGQPLYKYAEQKIWIPLGTEHNAYWGKDSKNGTTKAFSCFYATARDFAKLGLLVLNKGKYNGKQIVLEKYIEIITTPAFWLEHSSGYVDFYGLHLWILKTDNGYLPYFFGMYGQYIIILPNENAVIVRFGEMINELNINPIPNDLNLYLKVTNKILN